MPKPQSRTEYRVVGKTGELPPLDDGGEDFAREPVASLARAGKQVEFEEGYGFTHVRIQQRTVTETPWEDVQDGE